MGRKWSRALFLRWSVRDMPELELFESEQQRRQAIQEIEIESNNPFNAGVWIALVIGIVTVAAVRWVAKRVVPLLDLPPGIDTAVHILIILVTIVVVLRALNRWGTARELRAKLLEVGVPVCMYCGYCLRGLAPGARGCPECGRTIDERAATLLEQSDVEPTGR